MFYQRFSDVLDVYSSLGCFEVSKKLLGDVETVDACFAVASKDQYKVSQRIQWNSVNK